MTTPSVLPPVRATWACAKCHAAVRGLRAPDGALRDRVVRLAPGLYVGDALGRTVALAGEAALPLSRREAGRLVKRVRAGRLWPGAVAVRRPALARLAAAVAMPPARAARVAPVVVASHDAAEVSSAVAPAPAPTTWAVGGAPTLEGDVFAVVRAWAHAAEAPAWASLLRVVTAAYWRGLWARARRVSAMARLAGVSRRAAYAAVARVGLWGQAGGAATSAPAPEGEG